MTKLSNAAAAFGPIDSWTCVRFYPRVCAHPGLEILDREGDTVAETPPATSAADYERRLQQARMIAAAPQLFFMAETAAQILEGAAEAELLHEDDRELFRRLATSYQSVLHYVKTGVV